MQLARHLMQLASDGVRAQDARQGSDEAVVLDIDAGGIRCLLIAHARAHRAPSTR